MTMGFAGTQYSTFFDKIGPQKMSYIAFNDTVLKPYKDATPKETAKLDDLASAIKDAFGLDIASLSQTQRQQLEGAFQRTMGNEIERSGKEEEYLLYGGYEPLTVMLTHLAQPERRHRLDYLLPHRCSRSRVRQGRGFGTVRRLLRQYRHFKKMAASMGINVAL